MEIFVHRGRRIDDVRCWLSPILFLPDFPEDTCWLNGKERAVAELRMIADSGQADRNTSKREGLKMAFGSWQVWVFAGMQFFIGIGASLHNFFPSIVKTLGFQRNTTLWLTVPPYLVAVMVTITNALVADRHRNASFHIFGPTTFAIIGFLMFLFEHSANRKDVWVRYASSFLMLAGAHAAIPVVLAWTQKTIQRPKEMRACAIAIVSASGSVAQIVTSELYPHRWSPRYIQSMSLNTACGVAGIILAIFMRTMLQRKNEQIELEQAAAGIEIRTGSDEEEGRWAVGRRARRNLYFT